MKAMKRLMIICLLALFPLSGRAQDYYTIPAGVMETNLGGRFSLGVDKKLAKGLHLSVNGELRMKDSFSAVGRWQVGADLSCKVNPYLKLGGGYIFIDMLKRPREKAFPKLFFRLMAMNKVKF